MTYAHAHREWSPIGAMELKASYRGNMEKAVLLVILLFTAVIGGLAVAKMLTTDEPRIFVDYIRTIDGRTDQRLPPSVTPKVQQAHITEQKQALAFTPPEPAPDDEVVTEYTMLTRDDIVALNPSNSGDDGVIDGFTVTVPPNTEIFPPDSVFVLCEVMPVLLTPILPEYPEMARKAGIEGKVVVEVVVDTRGLVCDAKVIQSSGANAGFEEAALAAALLGKWRPAMQNKQPVRVRVSYPIVFRLK